MIIKCPKCDNVFLAPDDLEEGQTLQCGNCEHSWEMKNSSKEIPEMIKPTISNHSTDFRASNQETVKARNIFITIITVAVIITGGIKFKPEISKLVQPLSSVLSTIRKDLTSYENKLYIKNIEANETSNSILLIGEIENISLKDIKVPSLIVNGEKYTRDNVKTLNPGESLEFSIPLPKETAEPIKVSF